MRIRPISSARTPQVSMNAPRLVPTPSLKAVRNAAKRSQINGCAVKYHTDRLRTRLRDQRRTAVVLGVASVVSIAVCVAVTLTAGPVALAAVWTIPSGIFGGFVGVCSEIAQTRAEIRRASVAP
jgi:hypothetical protein